MTTTRDARNESDNEEIAQETSYNVTWACSTLFYFSFSYYCTNVMFFLDMTPIFNNNRPFRQRQRGNERHGKEIAQETSYVSWACSMFFYFLLFYCCTNNIFLDTTHLLLPISTTTTREREVRQGNHPRDVVRRLLGMQYVFIVHFSIAVLIMFS